MHKSVNIFKAPKAVHSKMVKIIYFVYVIYSIIIES